MVMKFGVIVPQEEIGGDVGALRAFVQAAEAMGFDHLVVFDSVLTENPGYEPLVLLGLYAGWTQRIGLMTGVIVAPSRPTLLLAKQAATVDVLSGGRLRLGLGVGWNQDEFTAMGADFQDRGAHIEEQMAVLRELWTKHRCRLRGAGTLSTMRQCRHCQCSARFRSGSAGRPKRFCAAWGGWRTAGFPLTWTRPTPPATTSCSSRSRVSTAKIGRA